MDDVVRQILADGTAWSLPRMMQRYRDYYRLSWSRAAMRQALRTGSHVFLPDDHDVFNNFAGSFRGKAGLDVAAGTIPLLPISHEAAGANLLGDIITAAHAAYMEYQYQTSSDIPGADSSEEASRTARLHLPSLANTVLPNATLSVPAPKPIPPSHELDRSLLRRVQEAHDATMQQTSSDQLTPLISHGPVPLEASQSLQVGRTGFLLVDTRLHRGTAYHADDHEHHIVSASSLARIWTMLREFERSPLVTEVVVASSIPIFWMDETMALLAYLYENDKYLSATTELPGTLALLEVLAASTKVRSAIGGDVHVLAHVRACRTSLMQHLEAELRRSSGPRRAGVLTGAFTMLAESLKIAGDAIAAKAMHAAAAAWNDSSLPSTDPAAILRQALTGEPVTADWASATNDKRCFTQLVTSGVTVHSASLTSPVIAYYNGALRWLSRFREAHWSANITDIMQANNYIRLDIPGSGPGVVPAGTEWWSRQEALVLGDAATPAHQRWRETDGFVPLRCSGTGAGMLGSTAVRLLDVPPRAPTDWVQYSEPRATLRFVTHVRAAQAVQPVAMGHTNDEGIICECGAVPASAIVVTACRRALRSDSWVWQQAMTDSGFIVVQGVALILAGIASCLACLRMWAGCCCGSRQDVGQDLHLD